MNLKKYTDLSPSERGAPCLEYPGEWLVCIPEGLGEHWSRFWFSKERTHLGHSYQTFEEALQIGKDFLNYLEEARVEYQASKISVCWKATDNDPRASQVWFTPFYQHGKFNVFGEYKQS
jgi:hypothetical protein